MYSASIQPLLTRPDALSDDQDAPLSQLTAACPEMTSLAGLIRSFADLLKPDPGNHAKLTDWTQSARACDLPNLHAFTRGLDLDIDATTAAVTLPYHNGRTEGASTKTKLIKRQMYGLAGFALLRHRILLASTTRRHHRKCARAKFPTSVPTSAAGWQRPKPSRDLDRPTKNGRNYWPVNTMNNAMAESFSPH